MRRLNNWLISVVTESYYYSGVTVQRGALINLATQGPLRRQIYQQKFAKFPTSKR